MLLTFSIIVCICSLLNEEEDDNFGDNVWDDMVMCDGAAGASCDSFSAVRSLSASSLLCLLLDLSSCTSLKRQIYATSDNDEKQIKSQQFSLVFRCKNKAFMFHHGRSLSLVCVGRAYDGMQEAEAWRKILLLVLIELCL